MKPFRKILIPVDFSPASRRALHHALGLARAYAATVHVVHVWEPPGLVKADLDAWSTGHVEAMPAAARRAADDQMRELLDDFGFAASERPEYEILAGDPARAIVEMVNAGGYDLIVMGTHGRTGFSRLLVGSVAENVVRRARCPVLTVRDDVKETRQSSARSARPDPRASGEHS
jgi:nucleotide-binding universal stress UspA family protein